MCVTLGQRRRSYPLGHPLSSWILRTRIIWTPGVSSVTAWHLVFALAPYTGQLIKSYSNISETATKTKYSRNMVKPSPLFMRQRKQAIDSTTNTSIINRMVMEQTMPTEFTSTGAP